MFSPAYMLGALDALVKAGAVSPAYAAGASGVLGKCAGLMSDTFYNTLDEKYGDWVKSHPNQQISPRLARRMVLESLNWYDNIGPDGGFGNWVRRKWGNLSRPFREWAGSSTVPPEGAYDRAYRDDINKWLDDYLSKRTQVNATLRAALQDEFVRDADRRVHDAATHMTRYERAARGLPDNYSDRYRRNPEAVAMMVSGKYKPKYDRKTIKPSSGYGQGLPKEYGANRHLFHMVGYKDLLKD